MASCSMTLAYCLVSKNHSEMSALPSTVDVACPAASSPWCSDSPTGWALQLRARKTLFLLERTQPPGQSVARACLDHCSTPRAHTKTFSLAEGNGPGLIPTHRHHLGFPEHAESCPCSSTEAPAEGTWCSQQVLYGPSTMLVVDRKEKHFL